MAWTGTTSPFRLSNDAVRKSDHTPSKDWTKMYKDSDLEGLRRTMQNLKQNRQCPGRDSNRVSPEYNSELFPLEPSFSVSPDTRCTQNTKRMLFAGRLSRVGVKSRN